MDDPFDCCNDDREHDRSTKHQKYQNRPGCVHGGVLGAAKMEILAPTSQHFGSLHKVVCKHMFDLQGNKQKQDGADRYGQSDIPFSTLVVENIA